MDAIAVNQITIDQALFEESFDATFSKKHHKMLIACGLAFLIAGLILFVVGTYYTQSMPVSFPVLLAGIIVTIWALRFHKSQRKRKYRIFRKRNGDASARTVYFFHRNLSVHIPERDPLNIEYTDVKEIRETSRMYILMCTNKRGIMLAKDGFTSGSIDEIRVMIDKAAQEKQAQLALM